MNAYPALPPRFHWTPEQLAEAVRQRRSERFRSGASRGRPAPAASATRQRLRVAHGDRHATRSPRSRTS